jgi:hypothetical protein
MPALATTARDVHKEMHQGLSFEAAAGARPRGQEETKRPRGRAASDAPAIHEERERAPSAAAVPSVTRRSIDCPCIGWPCKFLTPVLIKIATYAILYACVAAVGEAVPGCL